MINLNYIKRYLSTNDVSFLIDLDKTINVDKTGKYYYHKMFGIEHDLIKDFIFKLESKNIYMFLPIVSINSQISEPYLTLSRQILITNQSNYTLIHNYLLNQIQIGFNSFRIDNSRRYDFFLIFKYKTVKLDNRIFT